MIISVLERILGMDFVQFLVQKEKIRNTSTIKMG